MIISVSRRTDIPAFYSRWFVNRIRAGYCTVPNPFNPKQVTRVSLKPEEVEAIVFWTRNPRPMFPFLTELSERGYRYMFNFTVLDNPRQFDASCPTVKTSIENFQRLTDQIGTGKVIWRYDPIVLSNVTDDAFHRRAFKEIASALQGYARRCIISMVQIYRKSIKRLNDLEKEGIQLHDWNAAAISPLLESLAYTARHCEMDIFSCCQDTDYSLLGVRPGKCIDAKYLSDVLGIRLEQKKDPSQRENCGCTSSKDIGMYDTCLFGCRYCYATSSLQRAQMNHKRHKEDSPSLLGWHEPEITTERE